MSSPGKNRLPLAIAAHSPTRLSITNVSSGHCVRTSLCLARESQFMSLHTSMPSITASTPNLSCERRLQRQRTLTPGFPRFPHEKQAPITPDARRLRGVDASPPTNEIHESRFHCCSVHDTEAAERLPHRTHCPQTYSLTATERLRSPQETSDSLNGRRTGNHRTSHNQLHTSFLRERPNPTARNASRNAVSIRSTSPTRE